MGLQLEIWELRRISAVIRQHQGRVQQMKQTGAGESMLEGGGRSMEGGGGIFIVQSCK
jgi:hypothetical protein